MTSPDESTANSSSHVAQDPPESSEEASDSNGYGDKEGASQNGLHDLGDMANEIEDLALSSAITEVEMSIEAAQTNVFRVQELRHLANAGEEERSNVRNSSESKDTSSISEVDTALMQLDAQLETTSNEVTSLQKRLDAFIGNNSSASFLSDKWAETIVHWQSAQKDAERLREELVEDKYLVVYRTVSRQAEDMMQSLEKVFLQCHTFVHDIHRKYSATASPKGSSSNDLQGDLAMFLSLHKSLYQKSKYYLPSCARVLKVIDSGIAQQRSLNGEVLHSHSEMKTRWRNLQQRMERIEVEMRSAQELLGERGAVEEPQPSTGSSEMSAKASRSSSISTSNGSESAMATVRRKTGDWLTPSPPKAKRSVSGATLGTPTQDSRAKSPFSKIASRLKGNRNQDDSPPPPLPTSSPEYKGREFPRKSSYGPPPQSGSTFPKSESNESFSTPVNKKPPLRARQSAPQHRYTQSASIFADLPPHPSFPSSSRPSYNTHISSAISERARSPMPRPISGMSGAFSATGSTTENRPRWNGSVRLQKDDLASSLPASKGRKSLPAFDSPIKSDRATPVRPASRNFAMTPSLQRRPPSPTFSATSNTSASAVRARPQSPNSKIPAPASQVYASHSPSKIRQQPSGLPDEADTETLLFGSANQSYEDSSLMARALSPTSSTSTAGASRRQSHIPRLSLSTASSHNTPFGMSGNRSDIMTPEPTLRSRAARASAVYGGGGRGGRTSLGLPQAGSPIALGRTPRISSTSSSSGYASPRRSITPSPLFSSMHAPTSEDDALQSGPYNPTPWDPLDLEIAALVNSQPLFVPCERVDLPLKKAEADIQPTSERMARYRFGWTDGKDISCKLIDRGPTKGKKVLCKVGGGWQDLSIFLLNQQARY